MSEASRQMRTSTHGEIMCVCVCVCVSPYYARVDELLLSVQCGDAVVLHTGDVLITQINQFIN